MDPSYEDFEAAAALSIETLNGRDNSSDVKRAPMSTSTCYLKRTFE